MLIGDVNASVGNSEVVGVVVEWGVDGLNEHGAVLVELSTGRIRNHEILVSSLSGILSSFIITTLLSQTIGTE